MSNRAVLAYTLYPSETSGRQSVQKPIAQCPKLQSVSPPTNSSSGHSQRIVPQVGRSRTSGQMALKWNPDLKDGNVYRLDASSGVTRGNTNGQTSLWPPMWRNRRGYMPPPIQTLELKAIDTTYRAIILDLGALWLQVCTDTSLTYMYLTPTGALLDPYICSDVHNVTVA